MKCIVEFISVVILYGPEKDTGCMGYRIEDRKQNMKHVQMLRSHSDSGIFSVCAPPPSHPLSWEGTNGKHAFFLREML